MRPIASFTVDHLRLEPGVYVSRVDTDPATGARVTTLDLRLTAPNREPVMDTGAVHALEHLLATYLRNDEQWSSRIVYAGPMGCRTGFYVVVFGSCTPAEIAPLLVRAFEYARDFEGEVPGARPTECGNWHDSDLPMATWWAWRYLQTLYHLDEAHTTYPTIPEEDQA
ncbi:MAG: S-ribosylhomocysteine lyase [Acidobacteriota bacterium]|nr:S-ribosylhomocysteine lyase [Acidobacteriota bacterium]